MSNELVPVSQGPLARMKELQRLLGRDGIDARIVRPEGAGSGG